jgi:hypothetical protein
VGTEKGPKIMFIMDYQISRERAGLLSRTVHGLRRYFEVDLIQNAELKEGELLNRLELGQFQLVLAPLNIYLNWTKVEGFFGINRTSGPTFAGYLAEPMALSDLPGPDSQLRRIILDLVHLEAGEITTLIHSLVYDTRRTGLSPLLEPKVPIFFENWYGRQDHGKRIEHFLEQPEIKESPWNRRSSAIRILMNALWSLIYEEGPGKRESGALNVTNQAPTAYFQAGVDPHIIALRLYYRSYPRSSPKEIIRQFWPDSSTPTRAPQLLFSYSDFLRVNIFMETGDIEIVLGLLRSGPSEKSHNQARTIWIDPVSPKLLLEKPFEVPPANSRYKSLPDIASIGGSDKSQMERLQREVVVDATAKFEALKRKAAEKTKSESVSGSHALDSSVGRHTPNKLPGKLSGKPPGPDPESLLEAFQQRYFEARQQIRQFEIQIANIEKKGAKSQELKTLQLKMDALLNRQKHCIKRLMEMLESYNKETLRKKGGPS